MDLNYDDGDDPLTMVVDDQQHNPDDCHMDNNDNMDSPSAGPRNGAVSSRHGRRVKDDFSDIISATIRNRSKGTGLCSALCLASSMALVSVALAVSYTMNHLAEQKLSDGRNLVLQQSPNVSTTTASTCASSLIMASSSVDHPFWAQLLTFQIDLIQNLIHASLLGGAALIIAYRGDVLWLFFVRNCSFYFGLAAFSYLIIDSHTVLSLLWNDTTTPSIAWAMLSDSSLFLLPLGMRLLLTLLFVLSATTAFCCLDPVVRRVRKLQHQHFRTVVTLPVSNSRTDCNSFPPYLAETTSDCQRTNVIFYCTLFVQLISILYRSWTTWQALYPIILPWCETTTMDGSLTDPFHPFEAAYSIGAHESFLLALMMLSAVFPRDVSSVGGAILASGWRLLLASGNIVHLVLHWQNDQRDLYSAVFTGLETLSLVPIFISALLLANNLKGHGSLSWFRSNKQVAYSPLDVNDEEEEEDDDYLDRESSISNSKPDDRPIQKIQVPSLLLISMSHRFMTLQTWGAYLLWASCCTLFMGMTMETMMLLRVNEIGSPIHNNVYKWGMHICVMYSFCTIMNVTSQDVYGRARILLFIACPMGSIVALWQLSILYMDNTRRGTLAVDRDTFFVMCLLCVRALSGFGQVMGLKFLSNIKPRMIDEELNPTVDAARLSSAQSLARIVLFFFYVPCTLVYGFFVALVGNCAQPMISWTTPLSSLSECEDPNVTFMLVQNWPGIGVAFHFGMLTVIFAADGLSAVPSYPPSLAIGSLFAAHLGLLIACDFVWAFVQDSLDAVLSSPLQWGRLTVLFLWMVSSLLLYIALHRFWKLRMIPM